MYCTKQHSLETRVHLNWCLHIDLRLNELLFFDNFQRTVSVKKNIYDIENEVIYISEKLYTDQE